MGNYLDKWLFIAIFPAERQLHLCKCEDVPIFVFYMILNWKSFSYELVVGEKKSTH